MRMNWCTLIVIWLMYDACLSFYYNVPENFKLPGGIAIKICRNGKNQIMNEDKDNLRQRMASLIQWCKKCIAEPLGFVEQMDNQAWKYVPSFGKNEKCTLTQTNVNVPGKCVLGEEIFTNYITLIAAEVAEKVFKTFDNWKETKSDKYHKLGSDKTMVCENLLYISAARHIYFISVLYKLSDNNIRTCATTSKNRRTSKYLIPSDYCYPESYGSLTCTSDEDVGLIGHKAGILVKAFNEYFQQIFRKTSEEVMDTNIYAYSLEYAMPSLFIFPGVVGQNYQQEMELKDKTAEYKIQDITVALYKVKKYDENIFTKYTEQFNELIPKLKSIFDRRMTVLKSLTDHMQLGEDDVKSYSYLTNSLANSVQTVDKLDKNMRIVLYSLLFAAEAYHSRGALRVIVGSLQMNKKFITEKLDIFDYWVSMLENWGDTIKEYNHCKGETLQLDGTAECWLQMSKYMYRFLMSMDEVRNKLEASANAIPLANVKVNGALKTSKSWLDDYKKKGALKVPEASVSKFATKFGCDLKGKFSDCIGKISDIVAKYNDEMIKFANNNWKA